MTTVCLTMIVKNEAHVILELLEQVSPLIATWSIVDTGSTDGTQQIIKDFFTQRKIPGELYERPWRDFGTNRSEAFDLADGKADYLWVIDADDRIVGDLSFKRLTEDAYELLYGPDFTYWRKQLFKSGLGWKYIGVLHEYPHSNKAKSSGRIAGRYHIESRRLGARSRDPEKYAKDAAVLEQALSQDPSNARYWFYLGQSYWDAAQPQRALTAYQKRASMGGWQEEVYYSLFRCALCLKAAAEPEERIIKAFLDAYQARPTRAEPLHELARYFREKSQYGLAYHFAKGASLLPQPQEDILFLSRDVYEYRALDELATSAFYTPFWREGYEAAQVLRSRPFPESERSRIEKNIGFYKERLKKM